MSFAKLDQHYRKLEALNHAQSMLGVDEAVNMPEGGGEKRAEAMSTLAGLSHEMSADPQVGEWLAKAQSENLSAEQKSAVHEAAREYNNLTALNADFVKRRVSASMKSEQLWRQLRPKGDWKNFAPALHEVITLAREEAALRADKLKLAPYDAMMEQYDPGNRTAEITPLFQDLKIFLKDFVPKALDAQKRKPKPKAFKGKFPIEKQKALGLELMKAIKFDFNHGRLDVSHHPFCGGVPTDVRMTTRYRSDEFLSSLMGILHETGHGLYEQGLPKKWSHWAVGRARGMGAHESQSLLTEMVMSRTKSFWNFAMPLAKRHLGAGSMPRWTVDDLLRHVHHVERGLIRVEADEVTYPLHVIMRYEIEQDLISGKIKTRDIPEIWDQKMRENLGLSTIDNMKDGPMQDVHWPAGALGYFPSYTFGALMAAQQWAALEKSHPKVQSEISKGEFDTVHSWRQKNIWDKASFHSTPDLMRAATGEALNAKYFMAHLTARYLD